MRVDEKQRRALRLFPRNPQRAVNGIQFVAILNILRMPTVRLKAFGAVFGEGDVGPGGKCDVIIVVEADQLAEPQVTCERRGFGGNALHQIAIAGKHVRVMVDDLQAGAIVARGEICFGNRHADGVAKALSKRSGRGLDPGSEFSLRMPRRATAPLPKLLELVERQVVARKIEQTVKQH